MDDERHRLRMMHVEGTRGWLLEKVNAWVKGNVQQTSRVMWLKGGAGVGKSLIASLVSDTLQSTHSLASTFFCKHDDQSRNDPGRLINTIAYGLARWDNRVGRKLLEIREFEEEIIGKSVATRFDRLILEALQALSDSTEGQGRNVVIVLDALDECTGPSRASLLRIISTECAKLPPFVKLFVTSRPDADIVRAFSNLTCEDLTPSDENNLADLRVYCEWRMVGCGLEGEMLESAVNKLTRDSEGVFIWAVLACDQIEQADEINTLLDTIDSMPLGSDSLYARTFSTAFSSRPSPLLSATIGAIVTLKEPVTLPALASLMFKSELDVTRALNSIRGVLTVSQDGKIRMLHKSVKDYLIDPERCRDERFFVDRAVMVREVAGWCLRGLRDGLGYNACGLDTTMIDSDVVGLEKRAREVIPEWVRYCCRYWVEHLAEVGLTGMPEDDGLLELLDEVMKTKLLNWVEVSSITKQLDVAIPAMISFQSWCSSQQSTTSTTTTSTNLQTYASLSYDTQRLLQRSYHIIASTALQVYISAFPFTPSNSTLYKLYSPNLPIVPTLTLGQTRTWSPLRSTLRGHTAFVDVLSFFPGGSKIVSGSSDRTARVWDTASGNEVAVLKGHKGGVLSVAVADDNVHVATSSDDGTVRIWDGVTGAEVHIVKGHSDWVTCVAFVPGGKWLLTGSVDESLKVWDVETWECVETLRGFRGSLSCIAPSVDGKVFAVGSADRVVKLYAVGTWKLCREIREVTGLVKGLQFSVRGRYLACRCTGRKMYVWRADDWTTEGPHELVGMLEFVRMTGMSRDAPVAFLPPESENNEDSTRVVTTFGNDVAIWNFLDESAQSVLLKGHTNMVTGVAVSRYGQIASASTDGTVRVWDYKLSGNVPAGDDFVQAICVSEDGTRMALGKGNVLHVCNVEAGCDSAMGKGILKCYGHKDKVVCLEMSRDASKVISGSFDKTARVWNAETGEAICVLEHTNHIQAVGIFPDGSQALTGEGYGTFRIWDITSGTELRSAPGPKGTILFNAQLSFDGTRIFSAHNDFVPRVWDVATMKFHVVKFKDPDEGQLRVDFETHRFSRVFLDGSRLVTSSVADGKIRVWSTTDGSLVSELHNWAQGATSMGMTADGGIVAAFKHDTRVLPSWDARTGRMRNCIVLPPDYYDTAVCWDLGRNRVFVGLSDGGVLGLQNVV
ncbi:hypothetical protein HDV00_000500 [Rhizophlyctis rosea]|nr:hypothetical protein HDV00_000500 [Rhizophlyctis rosea]